MRTKIQGQYTKIFYFENFDVKATYKFIVKQF